MRYLTMLSVLCCALVFISCDSTTDPNVVEDPHVSAKSSFMANGLTYKNMVFKAADSDSLSFAVVETEGSASSGLITLYGTTNKTTEFFVLSIRLPKITEGNFPVASGLLTGITLRITDSETGVSKDLFCSSGEIQLEKWEGLNGSVKGTFSGTFEVNPVTSPKQEIIVTQGKFNIKHVQQ